MNGDAAKHRNIILVGHHISVDIRALEKIHGIDLMDRTKYPSVVGVMDISVLSNAMYVGSQLLNSSSVTMTGSIQLGPVDVNLLTDDQNRCYHVERPSLSDLLDKFEVPVKANSQHNGGNDARFTLHVLLMLATHERIHTLPLTSEITQKIAMLRAIAQAELPNGPVDTASYKQVREVRAKYIEKKRIRLEKRREEKLAAKAALAMLPDDWVDVIGDGMDLGSLWDS